MPNWCYNSLTIEGNAEDISAIKAQLNTPFQREHENWNPTTRQMEITTSAYSNPVFAFWNIIKPTNLEAYNQQDDFSKPIEERLKFIGDNWYDWNVRNWGTKWDVAVPDNDSYHETEIIEEWSDRLIYSFNTAWSPPAPAIENLSSQYPNLTFTLSFEEETGWGGEIEFVNGNTNIIEQYESKCRDCDSINTMEYCENDCGEICDSCHYMGEADLECVAECDTHKVYLDDEHVPEYRRVEA
jgi:hypothetical protein